MSNLENLVPPLELCKRIPEGKFADSALIWFFCGSWFVNAREFDAQSDDEEFPAPTLQEILEDLPTEIKEETTFLTMYDVRNKKKGFQFGYTAFHKITKKVVQSRIFCAKDDNAVISALKLWMKINNPDPENENLEDKENE